LYSGRKRLWNWVTFYTFHQFIEINSFQPARSKFVPLYVIFLIHNFFFPVVKSRLMRRAGQVTRMGEDRGVHRVFVGKPEGKRPLGRPRSRWEDNIKMDLQEVGGGRGDWMELTQDRDR
jgi:hypothetical protein